MNKLQQFQFALSSLFANGSGTVNPMADGKVKGRPWVTGHFAQGNTVLRNRIS